MEEQLIEFHTALLAKEKGFDWLGKGLYRTTSQSLLQRWLREIHNINVYSYPFKDHASDYNEPIVWKNSHTRQQEFNTYEEALEKGLYEALKVIGTTTKKGEDE